MSPSYVVPNGLSETFRECSDFGEVLMVGSLEKDDER